MARIFTALVVRTTRAPMRLEFREAQAPTVTRSPIGPVIVIHRGSNRLYLYNGHALRARLRRRDRAVDLPDAARPLVGSSSSGATPGGTRRTRRGPRARSRSRRARATRSARAGWASRASGVGIHGTPDDASIGYSALARLHPHAHPARPSGSSTTSASARRSSSSRPDVAAPAEARRRRPSRWRWSSGCSRLLIWKVAHGLAERARSSGKPAPDFTLSRLDRPGSLQLSSLRGKLVVLNFWASWCEPCKREAPTLVAAAKKWNGRVVVLGVDVNDSSRCGASVHAEARHHYPVVHDNGNVTIPKYGLTGDAGDVLHRSARTGRCAT